MRLIDADAAKEKACEKWTYVGTEIVCDFLDAQATIDAVPVVHGQWLEDGDTQTCSNCGEEHEWGDYRASYCDACGAKMEGEKQ